MVYNHIDNQLKREDSFLISGVWQPSHSFFCGAEGEMRVGIEKREGANLIGASSLCGLLWWSWRDLNPRPNVELMCFLHAYSSVGFRATAG